MTDHLQSRMIGHGALVFMLGLLAGFPFAFVIVGKVALWPIPGAIDWQPAGDVRAWHMAHLEGILNGLTLFGVAAILPRLRLGETGLKIVAWGLIVTAWGNIVASIIGPMFGGRGLAFLKCRHQFGRQRRIRSRLRTSDDRRPGQRAGGRVRRRGIPEQAPDRDDVPEIAHDEAATRARTGSVLQR